MGHRREMPRCRKVALRSAQPAREQLYPANLLCARPPVCTSQLLCLQTMVDEETRSGVGRTSLPHYNPLCVMVGHGCQDLRQWANSDRCRWRIPLAASSHGPARRRPRCDGRLLLTWNDCNTRILVGWQSSPFQGQRCFLHMKRGIEKIP